MAQTQAEAKYYVPHDTRWPLIGSVGLFVLFLGVSLWLNETAGGPIVVLLGAAIVIYMVVAWFAEVIRESESGLYNAQVDKSFRMGMTWFIFSEVTFFACFFGALFYARLLVQPWLGGEGSDSVTNAFLWPGFESGWPSSGPERIGGDFDVIGPWGLPAIMTGILLLSGVTITVAHHALKDGNRQALNWSLFLTFALGFLFLGLQAYEYTYLYTQLNLTLATGIYGNTLFMLSGFHGLHVLLGATMLVVIWLRCLKGHFTPERHFAFEAVAWYWHFVDVVWLALFIFVYWL
ncbi:MAG: cytochrome c oxidase subunit 3 [Chromatiales bacterium]|nr:cytochrome c oxidase subunit 3 [Chromatiales bacterium]